MLKPLKKAIAVNAVAAMLGGLALTSAVTAGETAGMSAVEKGKKVAVDRRKGNCLACHVMDDGALPGNIGPPLVAMKARFPGKGELRDQIWGATKKNPHSMMPPFGKHGVLTEEEVDVVTEYIHTL
ncbi:MAG: sulfur oxidation c-type cytochrome SoxX [Gammaproteobacteria bacterium]|nr:sulfur oxidation c-type cytochrome SoxX [Gammaproteobacteria bacterium]